MTNWYECELMMVKSANPLIYNGDKILNESEALLITGGHAPIINRM